MTKPERAGVRDGINLFGRKYGLIEDPYPLYDQKQADEFVADIEKLIESTCLEVIGEDEILPNVGETPEYKVNYMYACARNWMKSQQRQALSKLLGRGEEGSREETNI